MEEYGCQTTRGCGRVDQPALTIRPPLTSALRKSNPNFGDFAFSQSGNLWVVVGEAVWRCDTKAFLLRGFIKDETLESFSRSQGLTPNAVRALTIDREGNTWLATNSGIDQLRETPLTTVSLPLTRESTLSIAAGDNGTVWTGNETLPLTSVMPDGRIKIIAKTGSATSVWADYERSIWAASDGPVHLWHSVGQQFVPVHYPNEGTDRVVALAVDRNHEPWINVRSGPTYHLTHGAWRNENETLHKGVGILGTMTNDPDGNVWIAFENRLVRWDGESYQSFAFPYGTIGLSVASLAVRDDRVWLAGSGGILLFRKGAYHQLEFADHVLPGRVSGVVEARDGDLWINGFSGITHVAAADLRRWLADPAQKIVGEHLDALDGLPGLSADRFPEPSVVEASDGRIWFSTMKGIAWLNRASLERTRNKFPPPVFVTAVIANHKAYNILPNIDLPKKTENLEIDYTALSLSIPGRVQFRYKLDGIDKDWQQAGNRRQAFYTRLPPAHYTFLASASNNDGVWSTTDARLNFTLPPTFFQTRWFMLMCVCLVFLILFAIYLLRVKLLTARVRDRMLERMSERERIARDLHDTFFQGIQGLFLRFNTGTSILPADEPARRIFIEALEESDRVMAEGRELVLDLRSDEAIIASLAEDLSRLVPQKSDGGSPAYKVVTSGQVQRLHPTCGTELLRIGQEAVHNAFKHANAETVEVKILYETEFLKLTIRDDGVGIDENVIQQGRKPGHLGLVGMSERAARIRARYTVWSRRGQGTEVEVEVPAKIAYATKKLYKRSLKEKLGEY